MNITELDQYRLADAVKFHNRLNPKLWGPDEKLLPEVRSKLLEIAADFQEFLGVSDLEVKDITLSGSNAAYSYTPHSDIDLHLVVEQPQQDDEVYQELFNAKKYQYNDMHDIRIHGADVELYVQPANQPAVSLGEYSVLNNQWIEVPKRKRAKIDQTLVRHKYEDLKARIESALKDDDADRIQALIAKIKQMRQTGLDAHGEFGPENLAFKMLRKQGWIEKLYKAAAAARDRELSLKEQPAKPFRYGYGKADASDASDYRALFKPQPPKEPAVGNMEFKSPQDYEWFKKQQARKKELASEDAGETWDGVNPTTCMVVNEVESDLEPVVQDFIEVVAKRLGLQQLPRIQLHRDPAWGTDNHSFGRYDPDTHTLNVSLANRHILDILRTVAHELVHCRQNQAHPLPDEAGDTGSQWENEANAQAGIFMRDFAAAHPEYFNNEPLGESASGYIPTKKQARDPRYSMALTQDIRPGQVGKEANKMKLDTDSQGQPAMVYQSVNQLHESLAAEFQAFSEAKSYGYNSTPLSQVPGEREDELGNQEATGPEFPPEMPAGTTKIDVSDLTDWYRLGMDISDLDDAEPEDYNQGPPQTVIVFPSDEAEQGYLKQFKRLGLKTHDMDPDVSGGEDVYGKHLKELAEEFSLLEDEFLGEIKMSPSNLRAEAAKTGAQAGMEFEMIVPNVGSVDDDYGQDMEPDYDYDESINGFRDIRNFFHDGDHNSRRDVDNLENQLIEDYYGSDWLSEKKMEEWGEVAYDHVKDLVERDYEEDLYEQALSEVQAATPEFGTNEEEFKAAVDQRFEELKAEKIDEILADMGREYDEAFEEWESNEWNDLANDSDWQQEWLEDEGITTMRDVLRNYDINWPYWYDPNEGSGEANVDEVANDFSNAIGKPINASTSYHGARREAGHYVVEPDGSLEGDDSDDQGLEFVSPPMPIDEMMSDLNKVKAWADGRGCYTNSSTGLHINISVPNYSLEKLDYVKLALLLGDRYILDQYGRASNTYTKSALGKVQDKVRSQPDTARAMLDKMRGGMEQLASKAIHSGSTDKYTSINTKSGYIEFRSPGGDWLNENFDKIENTLLRFTVALSAAMDPEAYRQEYLKKLYKLLEPTAVETKNPDTIRYFADYVAGKTPKAALRSFVKQAQLERKIKRDPTGGQKYWWRVYKDGKGARNGAMMEVVATSKQEAIDKAATEWGFFSQEYKRLMDAEPVRPYSDAPVKASVGQPQSIGQRSGATVGGRASNPEGNWILARQGENPPVPLFRFSAAGVDDANTVTSQWSREHPGTDAVVHYDPQQRYGQPPVPGSTIDLQRQRVAAAQANATSAGQGNWGIWMRDAGRFSREPGQIDNSVLRRFPSREAAEQFIAQSRAENPATRTDIEVREIEPAASGPQEYNVINMNDRSTLTRFTAANQQAAEARAAQIFRNYGLDPDIYDVIPARPQQQSDPYRSVPIPGVTDVELDIPQAAPRPMGAGRELVGWSVRLPSGEEVTQIHGIGNNQGDANRIAAQWLRNNGYGVSGEGYEVVPIWREA